jgi:hypothetical protein
MNDLEDVRLVGDEELEDNDTLPCSSGIFLGFKVGTASAYSTSNPTHLIGALSRNF